MYGMVRSLTPIAMCTPRFEHNHAARGTLTLGQLEELAAVLNLLAELSRFPTQFAQRVPLTLAPGGILERVVRVFQSECLKF